MQSQTWTKTHASFKSRTLCIHQIRQIGLRACKACRAALLVPPISLNVKHQTLLAQKHMTILILRTTRRLSKYYLLLREQLSCKHKVGILKGVIASKDNHGVQTALFGFTAMLTLQKDPVPYLTLTQLVLGEVKSVAPESSH